MMKSYMLGVSLAVLASTSAWAQTTLDVVTLNRLSMESTAEQAKGASGTSKALVCVENDIFRNMAETSAISGSANFAAGWTDDVERNGRSPKSDTMLSYGGELNYSFDACFGSYRVGLGTSSNRYGDSNFLDSDTLYGLVSASYIIDMKTRKENNSQINHLLFNLAYRPVVIYDPGFADRNLTIHSLRASLSFQWADQSWVKTEVDSSGKENKNKKYATSYITPAIGISGNIVDPGEFNQFGLFADVTFGHRFSDELSAAIKPALNLRYYDDFFGMSRTDQELSAEVAMTWRPKDYKQFDLSAALRVGKTWSNVDIVDFDRVDVIAPMIKATWTFWSASDSN